MMKATGGGSDRRCEVKFLVGMMTFSILLWLSSVLSGRSSHGLWTFLQAFKLKKEGNDDVEVDSLLPTGFDDKSCISRYESVLYRPGKPWKPSPYLVSKLRSYEDRHKQCGPYTHSYNQTLQQLDSGSYMHNSNSTEPECKYIVWISYQGLGNKMLTIASAFLYALLTDRVLLVDRGVDIPDLFCEPFPDTSWFLPLDFPLTNHFSDLEYQSSRSYNSTVVQPYAYLHLAHDYEDQDKLFFCDDRQTYLHNIPWLIMQCDLYFVPSLFLMPSFQPELDKLFTEKQTVFHFLGRYLLHPTNSVWELITRYYETYLAKADVKVGIQVRVFDEAGPFTTDQILQCVKKENILPQVTQITININSSKTTRVGVVVTSLRSTYYERLRDIYWENPTESGEVVGVFQPSHEEIQQTEKPNHNRKALAEMYLLSLMDKLVTSGWSTFGYVGQSLGGVKPWIMYMPQNQSVVPDPPCGRAMSIEPCFHYSPYKDCQLKRADMGSVVPHVRHCEDRSWDIKLV